MNKQINSFNFFNFRNLLLIILSFIFIILASITLITQRSNNMETLPYLNTYIVISSLFILALVVSISFIIFPIILRVRRKKISTLNSKFTLYFISIALTPAILLGVLGLVLIELGVNDWFNNKINQRNSILRLIHYQLIDSAIKGIRAAPHEDINLITLLLGTQQEGLEVLDKNNNWIPIETNSDIIVCNVGDMLQRLTNHRLKSTTHKVINPMNSNKNLSRYSMPFFVHLNPDFLIKTLPQCINNEHPDLYPESILANDYLNMRLKEINLK